MSGVILLIPFNVLVTEYFYNLISAKNNYLRRLSKHVLQSLFIQIVQKWTHLYQ